MIWISTSQIKQKESIFAEIFFALVPLDKSEQYYELLHLLIMFSPVARQPDFLLSLTFLRFSTFFCWRTKQNKNACDVKARVYRMIYSLGQPSSEQAGKH